MMVFTDRFTPLIAPCEPRVHEACCIQYGICVCRKDGVRRWTGQVRTRQVITYSLPEKAVLRRSHQFPRGWISRSPGVQQADIILELSWYQTCDDRIESAMGMAACKRHEGELYEWLDRWWRIQRIA
jgi:hypothetical protein